MKILLINIALRPPPARKFFPVGLGFIASAIRRAGYELDLLDLDAHSQDAGETERFLRDHRYDVVAMGCIVTGYKHVKWLSQVVKKAFPETIVIVGNTVASSIPTILLTKTPTDIAVMGEGDVTIIELLRRLERSTDPDGILGITYRRGSDIASTPPRQPIENLDEIPYPNWDLFDLPVYMASLRDAINEPLPPIPRDEIRPMPINTARGCIYNCSFCYHAFRGVKYRWRSPRSVVDEMRHLQERYGINYFVFNDELTFFSIKQAEGFADALLTSGLKVYWDADCRAGLFSKDEHAEVARKLKEAGCMALSFSLESANPDILKWMNKKMSPETFSRQVGILSQAGLPSLTSIVFGYPNETESTIRATIDCCIQNGVYPSAGYLLPQPGTPMYDYARRQGYITDEEQYLLSIGDRQDLHINMTRMSDEQLQTVVEEELARCSRELGLSLKGAGLLKTGHYRLPKKKKDAP